MFGAVALKSFEMHGLLARSGGPMCFVAALLFASAALADEVQGPPADAEFRISLSEPNMEPTDGVGVYEIDLFDTEQATIDALHAADGYVICYFSAGSYEDWRPDIAQFPEKVLGKEYSGWPGERWLDIRQKKMLAPIMEARLDLARSKKCDAVDPDNVDGFSNDTGFKITAADQRKFNRWIAEAAHDRGLAVGLKNAAELVADLVGSFDFAVVESCATDDSCAAFGPFAEESKAVFQIEYAISAADWPAVCVKAKDRGFTAILANEKLDGKAQGCPR